MSGAELDFGYAEDVRADFGELPFGVAPLDLDRITGPLRVRRAAGDEHYLTLSGAVEPPAPGEVIFADAAGEAHARRWCHRQSGHSAIRAGTRRAAVIVEAMHPGGERAVAGVLAELAAIAPGRVRPIVGAGG